MPNVLRYLINQPNIYGLIIQLLQEFRDQVQLQHIQQLN
jgi:hypothetical protein